MFIKKRLNGFKAFQKVHLIKESFKLNFCLLIAFKGQRHYLSRLLSVMSSGERSRKMCSSIVQDKNGVLVRILNLEFI